MVCKGSENMQFRVAGIIRESVVDGPGLRCVIFAQGCPRSCPGCHNPDNIDPNGGKLMTVEEVALTVEKIRLITGVTFSGGDPFLQAKPFAALAKRFKSKGLNIMTYTGYKWEELMLLAEKDHSVKELLVNSDYLVDGPFIINQKDLNLPFRGSANQRIIDVQESLKTKQVVIAPFA